MEEVYLRVYLKPHETLHLHSYADNGIELRSIIWTYLIKLSKVIIVLTVDYLNYLHNFFLSQLHLIFIFSLIY